ncbi:MAG: ExbD/TolR family protein [Pseudomonadota bacterium]
MSLTRNLRQPRKHAAMATINVTPFVDVVLVLLIIFMVTAPLLTVGVPVDLPDSSAPNVSNVEEPITLTIQADGAVFIGDAQVEDGQLIPLLMAVAGARINEPVIFVRADRSLPYWRVMHVLGEVHSAGLTQVSLIADLPGQQT